jgi:hypothetical protein
MATGDPVHGQPGSFEAPLRVCVRGDEASGMAIAWIGPNDNSEPGSEGWIEAARIYMALANEHPDVYDLWVQMVSLMARRTTERVVGIILGRPVAVSGVVQYNPRTSHPMEDV